MHRHLLLLLGPVPDVDDGAVPGLLLVLSLLGLLLLGPSPQKPAFLEDFAQPSYAARAT